ncbi:MAG: GlsB/YeaQ/YmgE family stress response membrane protein [Hyphomicrobium sp.]|jgi:uncharacterized membrane protein YeaQ/YmgE (transglycosylase-associated protein family)
MDFVQYLTTHQELVVMVLNGLIAGWLAGLLLGGGGLIRNLIVGLIGAVVGGMLVSNGLLLLPYDFNAIIPYGNQIVVSTIGAMLVILLARFLGR